MSGRSALRGLIVVLASTAPAVAAAQSRPDVPTVPAPPPLPTTPGNEEGFSFSYSVGSGFSSRRIGSRPGERPSDVAEREMRHRQSGESDRVAGFVPLPLVEAPAPPPREGAIPGDLRLRPDGRGGFSCERPGYRVRIDRDGTIHFQDRPSLELAAVGPLWLVFRFDFTDALMRLAKQDPYGFDKEQVRRLTRSFRDRMVDGDRGERLDEALRALAGYLDALWSDASRPAADRRALLFDLWDECAEEGDPDLRSAAARARRQIASFIRDKLPATGPDAYTPDELHRMNAVRRSAAPFAPYEP